MRLSDQTETVIYPDEQAQMVDPDTASTDLGVLVQFIYFGQPVIIPMFWDRKNPRLQTRESLFKSLPIAKKTIILGGHAHQAQSDLMVTAEEEKQFDRAETDCIEKISQVNITKRVERIFRAVAEEIMEGEIAEGFAKDLSELIRQYEGFAVCEIEHFISEEKVTSESAEAALLILGDIDHKHTHNYRRWLLEKALIHCSSPIVRDGANVGLGYMDDPHAIPFLKKAIQNEENPLLRKVMNKTLSQLEDTQKCLSYCEVQNTTDG